MGTITVEEFKNCKLAHPDLVKKVREEAETCGNLENFCLEVDGTNYGLYCVEEGDWDDEGKYQYQYNLYQLSSFNKDIKNYLCDKSLIDKYNLFVGQCVTRCGSYFSDYYYEYDKPDVSVAYVEHIPEVVIPAHNEVKLKELKGAQ